MGKRDIRLELMLFVGKFSRLVEKTGNKAGTALQQDSRYYRHQMKGQKLAQVYIPPQKILDYRIHNPHGSADVEKNISPAGYRFLLH
jgi:hypothetical protein